MDEENRPVGGVAPAGEAVGTEQDQLDPATPAEDTPAGEDDAPKAE